MQLNKKQTRTRVSKKRIIKGSHMAAAASALLGAAHAGTLRAEEADWDFGALTSAYAESDDRTKVVSFKMNGVKERENGSATSFQIGIDAISGSSPSGAVGFVGLSKAPLKAELARAPLPVDTMAKSSGASAPPPPPPPRPAAPPPRQTTNSGGSSRPAPSNPAPRTTSSSGGSKPSSSSSSKPKPVAPTFKAFPLYGDVSDQRFSGSVGWVTPVGRLTKLSYGLSGSSEEDYKDIGVNSGISRDFNEKNTTLSAGINYAHDQIEGTIGNHAPLTLVDATGNTIGKQTKDVVDVLLGMTQVYSKKVIGQFNYTLSNSTGYMNDPYKVISIVDGQGRPIGHIYENRPDSRLSHALFGEFRIKTKSGVLKPSYRFFTNDWGITSHTFGLAYRRDVGKKSFIEPRVRFYTQTAADFYSTSLKSSDPVTPHVSSDYRLAAFNAITVGLHVGSKTRKGKRWSAGIDYYTHQGQETEAAPAGQLRVSPDLQAVTVRFDWHF